MTAYHCIVADPPWRFQDRLPGPARGAEKHYATLSPLEIERFPLPPIADDAYLFLWRVSSQVEAAYAVVRAWGFEPKTEIVWVKRFASGARWFGMGRTLRSEHETAIVAVRGKPRVLSKSIRSTFEAVVPEHRHSAKPEAFFDIVESLVAGPRVELFARRRRPGWLCLGDQVDAADVDPDDEPTVERPPTAPIEEAW